MGSIVVYATGRRGGHELYSLHLRVGDDPVKTVEFEREDSGALASAAKEASSNALLSKVEQEAISAQLAAIKESVKQTYALTAEQSAKLDAGFDEMR